MNKNWQKLYAKSRKDTKAPHMNILHISCWGYLGKFEDGNNVNLLPLYESKSMKILVKMQYGLLHNAPSEDIIRK